MMKFIWWLLGLVESDGTDNINPDRLCDCCGNGEFTQWERKQADFERQPTLSERASGVTGLIEYTQMWQERSCTMCGKIQQEDLDF